MSTGIKTKKLTFAKYGGMSSQALPLEGGGNNKVVAQSIIRENFIFAPGPQEYKKVNTELLGNESINSDSLFNSVRVEESNDGLDYSNNTVNAGFDIESNILPDDFKGDSDYDYSVIEPSKNSILNNNIRYIPTEQEESKQVPKQIKELTIEPIIINNKSVSAEREIVIEQPTTNEERPAVISDEYALNKPLFSVKKLYQEPEESEFSKAQKTSINSNDNIINIEEEDKLEDNQEVFNALSIGSREVKVEQTSQEEEEQTPNFGAGISISATKTIPRQTSGGGGLGIESSTNNNSITIPSFQTPPLAKGPQYDLPFRTTKPTISIAKQRPDIIMCSDFSPVYHEGDEEQRTMVGEFLRYIYSGRAIRKNNVISLMKSINNFKGSREYLQTITQKYYEEIQRAKQDANTAVTLLKRVASLRKKLNIKSNESGYKIQNISLRKYEDLLKIYGFFQDGGPFNNTSIENFSNTKILGQLLYDSQKTFEEYSPNLLGVSFSSKGGFLAAESSTRRDRVINFKDKAHNQKSLQEDNVKRSQDRSFGNYNKSVIDLTDGRFAYRTDIVRDTPVSLLGVQYDKWLNLLPDAPEDRIKLLIALFSKEITISFAMNQPETKDVLADFSFIDNAGNPFPYLIGEIGSNIVKPYNYKSIANVLSYDINNNTILPFEDSYIKLDEEQGYSKYTSGKKAIIDYIFESKDPFNISNLKTFKIRVDNAVNGVKGLKLLNLNGNFSGVTKKNRRIDNGRRIFRVLNSEIYNSIKKIQFATSLSLDQGSVSQVDVAGDDRLLYSSYGIVELATLRRAKVNKSLKNKLFQYVLFNLCLFYDSFDFSGAIKRDIGKKWGDLPFFENNETYKDFNLNSSIGFSAISGQYAFGRDFILNSFGERKSKENENIVALSFDDANLSFEFSRSIFMNSIQDFIIKSFFDISAKDFMTNKKTSFNRIRPTVIIAYLFEVYLAYIEILFDKNTISYLYGISDPYAEAGSDRSFVYAIINDISFIENITKAVKERKNYNSSVDYDKFLIAEEIGNKLWQEEKISNEILLRLDHTFNEISKALDDLISILSPDQDNYNNNLLSLLESQGGNMAFISEAQLYLVQKGLEEYELGNSLVSSDITDKGSASSQSNSQLENVKKFGL